MPGCEIGGCAPICGFPIAFVIAAPDELTLFIARWNYTAAWKGRFPAVFAGFR